MAVISGVGLPGLSEVVAANFEHLLEASQHWNALADSWERSFTEIRNSVVRPAGTLWTGAGATGAQSRTAQDLVKVRAPADQMRVAASVATQGYDRMTASRQSVLEAVEEARGDGFSVGEDYSVTDTRPATSSAQRAARESQAQGHASFIRNRVATLVANDSELAARIGSATAGMELLRFDEDKSGPHEPDAGVQLVGNHHRLSPPPNPDKSGADGGAGGYGPNPRHPGRDTAGRYTAGNSGTADGAAAAERALQVEEARASTTFIRQQVRVAITDPNTGRPMVDPQTGKPLYRYYDALEPVPGEPGKFVGIEVKSGSADLTRTQRIFDNTVSPNTPATGNLNGQPIEVIDARKIQAPQFVPTETGAGAGAAPRGGAAGAPGPSARGPFTELAPRAPVEVAPAPKAPVESVRPPWAMGGPPPPEAIPRLIPPPHSHRPDDLPVLGKDPLSDLEEFEP